MPSKTLYAEAIDKDTDEDFTHVIILSRWLDQLGVDLLITAVGTPSILDGPDAQLTIANEAKNGSAYTSLRKGTSHPAGEVIFVDFAGGTRGKQYDVKIPFTVTGGKTWVVIQPVRII